MRGEAKERGAIEQGFQKAEDGWHVVKFEEGIDFLKNKEGEISKTKAGDNRWKFPMIIDDENDESNGIKVDYITQENKRGEDMICSFLACVGLLEKFEKAFPGDISIFEDKVASKLKTQFPGQIMRIKTKQNAYKDKDGNEQIAVNIIGYGKMSDSVEKLEEELFGGKGKKDTKKSENKAAPAIDDEAF